MIFKKRKKNMTIEHANHCCFFSSKFKKKLKNIFNLYFLQKNSNARNFREKKTYSFFLTI